jgi:predicted  nucleic acid-binding Zn-ribbon protein
LWRVFYLMGATLEALRRLQEVEQQLVLLRQQEEKRKRLIRAQKRGIRKCAEALSDREADIRAHRKEVDRIDLDVKTREQTLARHREALNKAKTNKEYSSILTTINTEKVDSAKLEARELQLMAETETIRAEFARIEAEQAEHEQRLGEAERALQDYLDETADQRTTLEQQREEAAADVPASIRGIFDRVAERHDGEALAPVVRMHPKREEYACGGCNMKVTLENVNALRTRDDMQLCNACGRILYLDS